MRTQLFRLFVGDKHKVICKESMALGDIIFPSDLRVRLTNFYSQGILNAEDRIRCFIRVISEIESTRTQISIP